MSEECNQNERNGIAEKMNIYLQEQLSQPTFDATVIIWNIKCQHPFFSGSLWSSEQVSRLRPLYRASPTGKSTSYPI